MLPSFNPLFQFWRNHKNAENWQNVKNWPSNFKTAMRSALNGFLPLLLLLLPMKRRGIPKAAIQKATCLACPCWKKLSQTQILALNTWSPIDAKICCSKKSTDQAALRWSLVSAEEQTTVSIYSSSCFYIFSEPWLLLETTWWQWRWTHKVSYIPDLLGPWDTQSWHIPAWKVQIQAASSFVQVHECQCMERRAWKVMKVLHVLLLFQVNDRGIHLKFMKSAPKNTPLATKVFSCDMWVCYRRLRIMCYEPESIKS